MPFIALKKLHADPRNANVCDSATLGKLKQNIERSGFCPSLLVRPHPKRKGQYIIVDGHHRKLVAESLGWIEIECQVKEITEQEAGLLLLTLNRLRGTDNPRKRAQLIESLLDEFHIEDLSPLLPESNDEIEGLLALLKQDEEALEKALKEQIALEQTTLPVPFGFMVSADEAEVVRQALAFYQARTQSEQGAALVAICRDVLALHEVNDGQT